MKMGKKIITLKELKMKKCLIVLPVLFLFGCFGNSEVSYHQKGFTSYPTYHSNLPYCSKRLEKDQRTCLNSIDRPGTSTTQQTPECSTSAICIDLGTYSGTLKTQDAPIDTIKANSE